MAFISNFFANETNMALRHTWSLSIEEQFYVFWPLTLLGLINRSRNYALAFVLTIIGISPFIRALNSLQGGELSSLTYFLTYTRLDSMMFGCLGALLFDSSKVHALIIRGNRLIPAIFVGIIVLDPWLLSRFGGLYKYLFSYSFNGFIIMCLILLVTKIHQGGLYNLLNQKFIAYVGTISYGLYLWQQLFLSTSLYSRLGLFAALTFTFVVAALSFRYFETPILALRRLGAPTKMG